MKGSSHNRVNAAMSPVSIVSGCSLRQKSDMIIRPSSDTGNKKCFEVINTPFVDWLIVTLFYVE